MMFYWIAILKKFTYCASRNTFQQINIKCRNPTLKKCEDDTHTPKMGIWESFGTPKNSELNFKGQNTSP